MEHKTHEGHQHQHIADCSHAKIQHAGHIDYLHDGHLHSVHDGHVDEHVVEVSASNPETCMTHDCAAHGAEHKHGEQCGHEAIPHGSHTDYLVAGHLHHEHGSHCDDHGRVSTA